MELRATQLAVVNAQTLVAVTAVVISGIRVFRIAEKRQNIIKDVNWLAFPFCMGREK